MTFFVVLWVVRGGNSAPITWCGRWGRILRIATHKLGLAIWINSSTMSTRWGRHAKGRRFRGGGKKMVRLYRVQFWNVSNYFPSIFGEQIEFFLLLFFLGDCFDWLYFSIVKKTCQWIVYFQGSYVVILLISDLFWKWGVASTTPSLFYTKQSFTQWSIVYHT